MREGGRTLNWRRLDISTTVCESDTLAAMRKTLIAAVALLVGVTINVTETRLRAQAAAEAAVNRRVDSYYAAMRRGDAEAAAGFYHENGVRVGASVTVGRSNTLSAYRESFSDGGLPISFTRHATTLVSPNVAITYGSFEIEGVETGHVMTTLVKDGNEWFIAGYHSREDP